MGVRNHNRVSIFINILEETMVILWISNVDVFIFRPRVRYLFTVDFRFIYETLHVFFCMSEATITNDD